MLFFIFLYFFLYNLPLQSTLYYNSIIQLQIKPSPFDIKKDLEIITEKENAYQLENKSAVPIIKNILPNEKKDGLSLYKKEKNIYEELHYQIAKTLLETNLSGIAGIHAYYRGFTETSDNFGIIKFPRIDDKNNLPIIITEEIIPIILHGNIPDHFIVNKNTLYRSFVVTNSEDQESSIIKWIVKEDPSVITNNIIPFESIIIIGNPELFFFDNLPRIVDYSINIIIPPLYVLEKKTNNENYSNLALQTLQYFKSFSNKNYSTELEGQLHEGKNLR